MGRLDRERARVSGPASQPPEARPAHGPESLGHSRRLEGPADRGRTTFGEAALVQRCQLHKAPNILDCLSERDHPWVQAILRRAYQATELKTAQWLLLDLARRLGAAYPGAAESVREGLDETLTVPTLKLSPRLCRSLATTNAAESLISRTQAREAERQTVAWGPDDAALGRRRHPRSRERVWSIKGGRLICRNSSAPCGRVIGRSVS